MSDDLISREAAIDDIETVNPSMPLNVNWVKNWVKTLPSAQPDITEDDVKEFCKKRCWGVLTSDLYDEMIQRWSSAQAEDWMEQNKDRILKAGMEGREVEFRIGGRLFAIREKAQ